ncbi:MAG: AAA family ATPase [Bacteroidetes bacterium]|nr:AAA family ATPase [Bacteroidota bacterium]
MPNLLDAFDLYKDFDREAYFAVCFDKIPSQILLEVPLVAKKKNMTRVLDSIDFSSKKLELVFKNWHSEDTRDADFSKDYPYQHLFKSQSQSLLIWMSLSNDVLFVNFMYDGTDSDAENWVLETLHGLRTKFGLERKPVFRVLSKNKNGFFTKEVRTEGYQSDIQQMYNDDFVEVNELVEASMNSKKAGLILLHGLPGTGKTFYIKHLIAKFEDKKFIFIQNEFVNELLHHDFVSFLLKHQDAILIIEDAEKVLVSREHLNENSVVSTVLQLTDGLFSDYLNIKIICTFNTGLNKIDKALLRKGRTIAYYEFKALKPKKVNELLQSLGHEPSNKEMTLADIFNYKSKTFEEGEKKRIGF